MNAYDLDFPKEILDITPIYSENYDDHEAELIDCYYECNKINSELQRECFHECSAQEKYYGYVIPNETNPKKGVALYKLLEPGTAFMSVGSERSFFGAPLSKADRLIIVDMDINVCIFAYINRALLKISKNRNDYIWLRVHASEADWTNRFNKKGLVFEGGDETKKVEILWEYWNNRVRNVKSNKESTCKILSEAGYGLEEELEVFDSMHNGTAFNTVNYLFQDELYSHLKELAINNKIDIYNENIVQLNKNSQLIKDLKNKNICLGIVDISNSYSIPGYCSNLHVNSGYITTLEFVEFILNIAPYTNENSLIIAINMFHSFTDENAIKIQLPSHDYNAVKV